MVGCGEGGLDVSFPAVGCIRATMLRIDFFRGRGCFAGPQRASETDCWRANREQVFFALCMGVVLIKNITQGRKQGHRHQPCWLAVPRFSPFCCSHQLTFA